MDIQTFARNKKTYLAYNNFRKQIFSELAPEDSELILFLLPWMFSLNDPSVPGFVSGLQTPMAVYGVGTEPGILKRETIFQKLLKIDRPLSVKDAPVSALAISGIYTIGSIGTVGQTSSSDCDIWICVEKKDFSEIQFQQLVQKTNLIKDWLDIHSRIPVYFFICDVEDIRRSHFGFVDRESAGSTQTNTLKEEFYRTTILVAGKIPLWWLCYDPDRELDYSTFLRRYNGGDFGSGDCLDLGPLDSVGSDEYFGAALWFFNKALTQPLKSIVKMLLLEMLISSPRQKLLCHQFRSTILNREKDPRMIDPSAFTMEAILNYHQELSGDAFDFIKKCFYLRYEFRLNLKTTMKEILGKEVFRRHPIPRPEIEELNTFGDWPLQEQIQFGQRVFELLVDIYKRISAAREGTRSSVHPQDMNIIGRKLSVCLESRPNKILAFHRPARNLNIPRIVFSIDDQKVWSAATQDGWSIASSPDPVCCIASLIWNGIYQPALVRMTPNGTSVTLQEINRLAERIRDIFGVHDVSAIDFDYFLEPEKIARLLIVMNFEGYAQSGEISNFSLIYKNHWGEMFVRRFRTPLQFHEFIRQDPEKFSGVMIHYYIQRSALYYEKIIERTRAMISQSFSLSGE